VALVLDAETTLVIDVSATENGLLTRLAEDLRRREVELLIDHAIGQIRVVLRRAGGDDAVLPTVYAASMKP
jgi:MFS superfamily sulfate permease-like transporter